jgi:hypothetical protein
VQREVDGEPKRTEAGDPEPGGLAVATKVAGEDPEHGRPRRDREVVQPHLPTFAHQLVRRPCSRIEQVVGLLGATDRQVGWVEQPDLRQQ